MTDYAPLTPIQAEALAGWIACLRPIQRDWTKTACLDVVQRTITERTGDPVELARGLTAAALRPNVIEPTQMADDGPQWPTQIITSRRRAERELTGVQDEPAVLLEVPNA